MMPEAEVSPSCNQVLVKASAVEKRVGNGTSFPGVLVGI
jgi:hypothetical protein